MRNRVNRHARSTVLPTQTSPLTPLPPHHNHLLSLHASMFTPTSAATWSLSPAPPPSTTNQSPAPAPSGFSADFSFTVPTALAFSTTERPADCSPLLAEAVSTGDAETLRTRLALLSAEQRRQLAKIMVSEWCTRIISNDCSHRRDSPDIIYCTRPRCSDISTV